ncbi:MAG: ABC transporter permease subunit [Caldilineaceae bacterium]
MALAISSIGSVSKLYAEAIEQIDPQQVLAVRATGANRLLTFIYAVIPQALPVMASYTLLLFEGNIRHASILGLVGAGGVGFVIQKYIALFQYTRLMGTVILMVITVTLIDRLVTCANGLYDVTRTSFCKSYSRGESGKQNLLGAIKE